MVDRMVTVLSAANDTGVVVALLRNWGVAIPSVKLGLSADDFSTGTTVTGGGTLSNVDVGSVLDMVGRLEASSEVCIVGGEGVWLDFQARLELPPAKEMLGTPMLELGKRVVLV